MQEYWDLQSKILYSKVSVGESLRQKYNDLITSIQNIDNEIETLNNTFINTLYTKKVDSSNKFIEFYKNMKTQDILTNKDLKHIIKMHDDVFFHDKSHSDYISSEPLFLIEESKEVPITESNTKIPVSNIKPPHKILNKEQINIIKDRVTALLKEKFKAKNKDECASNKRSAPYYMNKDDLVKNIEKEKILKEIMPKNYKSLPKEKICEHLFFQ